MKYYRMVFLFLLIFVWIAAENTLGFYFFLFCLFSLILLIFLYNKFNPDKKYLLLGSLIYCIFSYFFVFIPINKKENLSIQGTIKKFAILPKEDIVKIKIKADLEFGGSPRSIVITKKELICEFKDAIKRSKDKYIVKRMFDYYGITFFLRNGEKFSITFSKNCGFVSNQKECFTLNIRYNPHYDVDDIDGIGFTNNMIWYQCEALAKVLKEKIDPLITNHSDKLFFEIK